MLPFKVAFPPKCWHVQQYLLVFEIALILYLKKLFFDQIVEFELRVF